MASAQQALRMARRIQRIKAFLFFFVFCFTGGIYPLIMCLVWGILLGILQMKEVSLSLRGTIKYLYVPQGYEIEESSRGFVEGFKANGVLGIIFNVIFIFTGCAFIFAISSFIGGGLMWLMNKDTGRHIWSNWYKGFSLASNKWVQREVPAEATEAAAE